MLEIKLFSLYVQKLLSYIMSGGDKDLEIQKETVERYLNLVKKEGYEKALDQLIKEIYKKLEKGEFDAEMDALYEIRLLFLESLKYEVNRRLKRMLHKLEEIL